MKSIQYFRPTVSFLLLIVATFCAKGCGPFPPIIPTPPFFSFYRSPKLLSDYDKEENLKLWQRLLGRDDLLSDIEKVVYRDSYTTFCKNLENGVAGNDVYRQLSGLEWNSDIVDFLKVAKSIEEAREATNNPWYYPRDRNSTDTPIDIKKILTLYRRNAHTRLADRYALQAVRVLFTNQQYDQCIEFADTAFAHYPSNNLMRRMANRYVAGCWSRIGDMAKADSLFASIGDIWSLSVTDKIGYMITHNPDAPLLMEYIQSNARDTAFIRNAGAQATGLLRRNAVTYRGDWEFLRAYDLWEYGHNLRQARQAIRRALANSFSSGEIADRARAYRMLLDGAATDRANLLADLSWAEGMINNEEGMGAQEWCRRVRNIIYTQWVPNLWKQKDYATAILLCSYADRLQPSDDNRVYSDQGTLSFQMMGSLTSAQLESAYRQVQSNKPLYRYLRRVARTDADYYNELIGTLALREERYDRAIRFLSKVSPEYQKSITICSEGYLARDPFKPYPTRWTTVTWPDGDSFEYERSVSERGKSVVMINAKLAFARKMLEYQKSMKHGRTTDERGWARLMYAIGLKNSQEECWALTQYWKQYTPWIFDPILQYWEEDYAKDNFGFLYDYDRTVGHKRTEARYDREIAAAKRMMTRPETLARMEYLFGNIKTVIRRYPDTPTAAAIRTSCDNWHNWL